ncbi:MAG: hypothetical protein ACT4N2_09980 [Hyphomicrobium sp.]
MTSTKLIALAASIAASSAQAQDAAPSLTMKPLAGISLDLGSERAVGYFQSADGACKLVLTLAGEPNWDNASVFAASRFEASIGAGKSVRYASDTGKAIDFACAADAQSVSASPVVRFADGGQ